MPLPPGVYRADHVGSLLRTPQIKEARAAYTSKQLSASALRQVEDAQITPLVQHQLDAGLRSVTDGEFRRAYFHLDFLQQLGGVEVRDDAVPAGGVPTGADNHLTRPPKLAVTGKLTHPRAVQVDDYVVLKEALASARGNAGATTKVCIPSPTMVHFRGGRASIDITAYPDLELFFADLAQVYQEELAALYEAGARFVQLDDTNLAYLCDEGMRRAAVERNDDPDELPRKYAALINEAISKRPKDLIIGIHLCRGNYRSQHFASGGYAPVAEALFKELNVDVYFLEYDDARSGDFEPLRMLPPNKIVVLGLMSSKKAELDDKDEIVRRLKEAEGFCQAGLDQICLSHQCGFSSTQEGNELSEEQQWAKIRLEVEIAKSIWGDDLAV